MHRVTGSALYGRALGEDGQWSAAAVWGMNAHHGERSHAVLLESEAVLDATHTLFSRAELAQKSDEDLVIPSPSSQPALPRHFDVAALSAGYVRELARFGSGTLGLGVMGTVNVVPSALEKEYGSRNPLGGMIFLRVRPFKSAMSMSGMDMGGGAHH